MPYSEILKKIGLTNTETKAYIGMTKLNRATPAQLADESGITRANAYHILSKMELSGLVSRVLESSKVEYKINSPDKLFELFEENENKLTESKVNLRKFIKQFTPKLNLIRAKPVIKYFQNDDDIKEAYYNFLVSTSGKTISGVVCRSDDPSFIDWMNNVYIKERIKKKLFLNLIVTDSNSADKIVSDDPKEMRHTKLIESKIFPKGTYICIDESKVMLITINYGSKENIGIQIDHPFIAKAIKALFEMAWE